MAGHNAVYPVFDQGTFTGVYTNARAALTDIGKRSGSQYWTVDGHQVTFRKALEVLLSSTNHVASGRCRTWRIMPRTECEL